MPQSIQSIGHGISGHAAASSGGFVDVVVVDRDPADIPHEFIDPQSSIEPLPCETLAQENRRK